MKNNISFLNTEKKFERIDEKLFPNYLAFNKDKFNLFFY